MAAYVLRYASDLGAKTALSILFDGGSEDWSYAALEAAVRGTATGLLQSGIKPGDRVFFRLGNTPDFPIAYLACIAAGIIPVPTSAQLTMGETEKMADIVGAKLALHDPELPCPTQLKTIDLTTLQSFRTLPPASYLMGDPNRMAYIIFTSGTSGTQRAVAHAHRAIWARGMMHEGWYAMTQSDRILHAGGFNWSFTLGTGLMDPWSLGATALIPMRDTCPQNLPHLLKQHKATLFAAAPGIYRQILKDHSVLDFPNLRHGLSAGEKLPETVRDAFLTASGCAIYEAFGMSECSTFISSTPSRPAPSGATGRAQKGRCISIRDAHGPVPIGAEGNIAIEASDPGLMLEYYNANEATAERFHDGWFLTGDVGRMDHNGQVTYLGRSDDMLNAGGFRVSPAEVEEVLNSIDGIETAAVTEIEVRPDVHVIAAFYTGPKALEPDDLQRKSAEALARFKQPRLFQHVDTLPTGPNGKISRRLLRCLHSPDTTSPNT